MELPAKKNAQQLLVKYLSQATQQKPLRIYVGSCPDYSHQHGFYTHDKVGDGVPLLTTVHLKHELELLTVLSKAEIPHEYVIMIADTEAIDEVFCKRFANGREDEFLKRCERSRQKTSEVLREARESGFLRGNLRSSTFFTEFGRDTFMRFQLGYQKVLTHTYEKDTSFNTRVVGDIITRMDMYRKMYRGIINGMDSLERQKFLAGRTMRTMAQYLALGRLIGEKTNECFPVIICHPTQNIGLFNGRNKFLLPSDGTFPQPTIPVIKMKKEVY